MHQPGQSCFVDTAALFQMSHLKLHTSHSTLHTSHFTALFTLHTSHFTLHTSHSTLHLISSRLSVSHLVSANLFSSQLISSHMSSKFFSTMFISSKDCSTVFVSSKLFLTHLNRKLLHIGTFYTEKLLHTQKLLQTEAFAQRLLHAQNGNRIHKILPCTTLYYKPCSKHFPVLLSTAILAQSTSTTKLTQITSQYYFVLQSLHETLPVLRIRLAKNPFQYHFVPQLTSLGQPTSRSRHFSKSALL